MEKYIEERGFFTFLSLLSQIHEGFDHSGIFSAKRHSVRILSTDRISYYDLQIFRLIVKVESVSLSTTLFYCDSLIIGT